MPEQSGFDATREHCPHRCGDETLDLARLVLNLLADDHGEAVAYCGQRANDSLDRLYDGGALEAGDYHDPGWPQAVRELTQDAGVAAAINAAPAGEVETLSTVADAGRFATITGSPPASERGISIADVYVRADGEQLRELAGSLAERELEVQVAGVYPLARAADALALVTRGGSGGAIVLRP